MLSSGMSSVVVVDLDVDLVVDEVFTYSLCFLKISPTGAPTIAPGFLGVFRLDL